MRHPPPANAATRRRIDERLKGGKNVTAQRGHGRGERRPRSGGPHNGASGGSIGDTTGGRRPPPAHHPPTGRPAAAAAATAVPTATTTATAYRCGRRWGRWSPRDIAASATATAAAVATSSASRNRRRPGSRREPPLGRARRRGWRLRTVGAGVSRGALGRTGGWRRREGGTSLTGGAAPRRWGRWCQPWGKVRRQRRRRLRRWRRPQRQPRRAQGRLVHSAGQGEAAGSEQWRGEGIRGWVGGEGEGGEGHLHNSVKRDAGRAQGGMAACSGGGGSRRRRPCPAGTGSGAARWHTPATPLRSPALPLPPGAVGLPLSLPSPSPPPPHSRAARDVLPSASSSRHVVATHPPLLLPHPLPP